MQLYADHGPRRARQLTGDILAIVFIGIWIMVGVFVYQAIAAFTQLGIQMQDAGAGLKSTMVELGDTLGAVPLIGAGIRVPFDGASDAGAALEDAGQNQQDSVLATAGAVGVFVAVVPIILILLLWLLPRIRFSRRATEAKILLRTPGGADLLALRALSSRKFTELIEVSPDAASQWRAGEQGTVARLAQLQLRSLGVRSTLVER